jgi:hypothetical protein
MGYYDTWIQQQIPGTVAGKQLYHYTGQAGFLGIIQNKAFWASHILYSNDTKEFELALDLLLRYVNTNQVVINGSPILGDTINNYIHNFQNKSVYIISLTESFDVLSQWRAYGNSSHGYCIGFRRHYLNKVISKNWRRFRIAKVMYDDAKHQQLIADTVSHAQNAALLAAPNDQQNIFLRSLCDRMLYVAPLIKHKGFEEEKEWRVLFQITNSDLIKMRVAKTGFVPYYIRKLPVKVLGDIIIGPCSDMELARNSTLFACYCNGIEFGGSFRRDCINSQIPYRNW